MSEARRPQVRIILPNDKFIRRFVVYFIDKIIFVGMGRLYCINYIKCYLIITVFVLNISKSNMNTNIIIAV